MDRTKEYFKVPTHKKSYINHYTGPNLDHVAFPLGGIGAGMICIGGTGEISQVSIRNRPELPLSTRIFAALSVKNHKPARLIEGPVPKWRIFTGKEWGNGLVHTTYGLPRFTSASFSSQFPFANISLTDTILPISVEILAWSPFTPPNPDDSSIPVAGLEYTFTNSSDIPLETIFSFHAERLYGNETGFSVHAAEEGFVVKHENDKKEPWDHVSFCVSAPGHSPVVDCAWYRGSWYDAFSKVWERISSNELILKDPVSSGKPSSGGSLYIPLLLQPGKKETVRIALCWHAPHSDQYSGIDLKPDIPKETYVPWYAGKFANIKEIALFWRTSYDQLKKSSFCFSKTLFNTNLPSEMVKSVASTLSILKSPTVLRQTDGKLWCWEGCRDYVGSCAGSCTHVWNYAQAICHLFPSLERTLRETEFEINQDDSGHQNFRSGLPIRPQPHIYHAAADGQLGGIIKTFREWRISGDTGWLQRLWAKMKKSLEYSISTWDPSEEGILSEPHHNTYDIEFWGPDTMCGTFYLGALKAAALIADALGEEAERYTSLYHKGKIYLETKLFNGEYFFQEIRRDHLLPIPFKNPLLQELTEEDKELIEREGPKYQYGTGCLSDGVLGDWIAQVCGIGPILDPVKVKSHLKAVYQYNFKKDLTLHHNTQRPGYAIGNEAGLLLCSWPKGGTPSIPFPYSNEIWTGIEYQVASHLMMNGLVSEAREIVSAIRNRYNGETRNPFDEYECGHFYGRALAAFGLLQGISGIRYDALQKVLFIAPSIPGDFTAPLFTETGYGTAGVRNKKPFIEVRSGAIETIRIDYTQFAES